MKPLELLKPLEPIKPLKPLKPLELIKPPKPLKPTPPLYDEYLHAFLLNLKHPAGLRYQIALHPA